MLNLNGEKGSDADEVMMENSCVFTYQAGKFQTFNPFFRKEVNNTHLNFFSLCFLTVEFRSKK
jgi:hypothetical protein